MLSFKSRIVFYENFISFDYEIVFNCKLTLTNKGNSEIVSYVFNNFHTMNTQLVQWKGLFARSELDSRKPVHIPFFINKHSSLH